MRIRVVLKWLSLAFLATLHVQTVRAGVAFPNPPGGWTYIYDGNEDVAGAEGSGFSSLDGTWSHDNGSDAWDGSKPGGVFSTGGFGVANSPGGVDSITEQGVTYLRIQDTGDPRDYFVPGTSTRFTDPSNRKIYFGHNMSERGAVDNMLDDGITLSFRARIPTAGKTTAPLDPLFRQGQQGPQRTNTAAYPAQGDGYVTSDSGKGNFVLRQMTGGAIAFSLTQSTDNPTGNPADRPANFSGLTMNEFAGNLVAGNVNFGQGSATNVIPFDPTLWHELWIVIRKDPANVGTHQAFMYLDGNLNPAVFKITAGTGSDYGGMSYLAIGSTATPQNSALDIDFVAYKTGAEFPPGALDNLPPEINGLTPSSGATFQSASAGIAFEATTGATNALSASTMKLILNGEDVSARLAVAGSIQNRSVTYRALLPNKVYLGELVVADQSGRSTTNKVSFDTFAETDTIVVEAEDYNHGDGTCDLGSGNPSVSGGRYLPAPAPSGFFNNAYINRQNGYVDRVGAPGIDFKDFNLTAPSSAANAYRSCDIVGTLASTDSIRPKFNAALLPDYDLAGIQAGEWLNYTRNFTAGKYLLYLRAASVGTQRVQLDLVTGNRAAAGQTTEPLGTFILPNSGSVGSYNYGVLNDVTGRPLALQLSGETTLRLTSLDAAGNLQINYILLLKAPSDPTPPAVAQANPGPNQTGVSPSTAIRLSVANGDQPLDLATIRVLLNGTAVTPTVIASTRGAQLSLTPPSLLATNATHRVEVSFQAAGSAVRYTNAWSFSTPAYVNVLPAEFRTGPETVAGKARGFKLKIHKAPNDADGGLFGNSASRAEDQLANRILDLSSGQPYLNEADSGNGGRFVESQTLNYEQSASGVAGFFGSDAEFPGIPGGDANFIALEAVTYLELPAGLVRLGVRSDDGFRVASGPTSTNADNVLGLFDGGRGSGLPGGATEFDFLVSRAGIYAFRLTYWEGTGGADLEWYSVDPATQERILVNDPSNPRAIKAYQSRSADPSPVPAITSIGLNFGSERAGAKLAATDVAGVPGVAQANWNNIPNGAGTNVSGIVLNDAGTAAATTVSVTFTSAGTWASTGAGEENNKFTGADKALLTGYLDTGNATLTTVNVSGIPSSLADGGYDVYVYAMGGVGGRGGAFRLVDGVTGQVIKDYVRAITPTNLTEFVEVAQNIGGVNPNGANRYGLGNYIVFKGVNAANLTVQASTLAPLGTSSVPRAPINAIQIVSPSKGSALRNVLQPGDAVIASHTDPADSPANEKVHNAIDRQMSTKYLNFKKLNTGFTVTPRAGASTVSAIALTSANDSPDRDPASYKLEGSNDGTTFATISEGAVATFSGRYIRQEIEFENTTSYKAYRVTFPTLANATTANSMQIAEVELLGTVVGPAIGVSVGIAKAATGNSVVLNYTGVLQSANTVDGPYTDVVGAVSPFTTTATGNKYYRARR